MIEEKQYHALHEDKIFMGGADDVEDMVKNEGVEVVVDLRGEATGCAYPEANVEWIQIPLGDNATDGQEVLFKRAIDEVVKAYNNGKKVAFHCGGGKGRTGTVAAGTLIELGIAKTIDETEVKAKSIRSIIKIKPDQRESLEKIFGE
ncbi:dual specificity protein phosphatase family protein [Paenibacillus sp. GP183]|uniref:protein-tyrosine phosphatase family protein n=1 Tax=Paenibacillus sp. GP183 TaxID=1882751 RepID=UPI000895C9E6|nr:dual specificity protein phosphatase family protein [Paenibacillus sp. GP183]SEB93570.1 Dual specificity phosphatase, catalytic domain [Paenibacillus sp. GP183]